MAGLLTFRVIRNITSSILLFETPYCLQLHGQAGQETIIMPSLEIERALARQTSRTVNLTSSSFDGVRLGLKDFN